MFADKKLIVGLGNPGKEYEKTYHNVGAQALTTIASKILFVAHKKIGKALFSYATTDDMVFVIPLVFMNESGKAVKEALKKFNVKPEELIVIHDESDLPVGEYKISVGRGAAGHKGVQSIVDTLHTNQFTRIRIGVRNPREKQRTKASTFVLKKISTKDRKVLARVFASLV